ncbi:MAG TPA: hypothetical protein VK203_24555 [Nostocaceae cyanobacterium]|nr:hypothetical protein [Nostocaceae cyanobacterium]
MYTRQYQKKQNSSNSSQTPTTNRFTPSKSFVQPSQPMTPEQEQAFKAESERIKASESNWLDVSLFTNRPAPAPPPRVQMKLKIDTSQGLTKSNIEVFLCNYFLFLVRNLEKLVLSYFTF